MAANKLSAEVRQKRREEVAKEFADFRHNYLFRQVDLADALRISRRSVQAIEAAVHLPQVSTRQRFHDLKRELARKQQGAA
jgi:DNA-binding XRE family transcriptional regulator